MQTGHSRLRVALPLAVFILGASPALALANRVFVSARSGNNANPCDNVLTPCQTFAGAVMQLNPDGEVIVLDSGGYGPVAITKGITIEAPAGVTAFIHPPSGHAITVSAPDSTVTLRGLVLNVGGSSNGIEVTAVGTLNVENCFITGFWFGIHMGAAGRLNVKDTDVKSCFIGIEIDNLTGTTTASIESSHLDANQAGYRAQTGTGGGSNTTATRTAANNNNQIGWICGNMTNGIDVLNLEFCEGSGNGWWGLSTYSYNASSATRYSNSIFSNNADYGVFSGGAGTCQTRGNNTITGNGTAPSYGTIGSFSPQ